MPTNQTSAVTAADRRARRAHRHMQARITWTEGDTAKLAAEVVNTPHGPEVVRVGADWTKG